MCINLLEFLVPVLYKRIKHVKIMKYVYSKQRLKLTISSVIFIGIFLLNSYLYIFNFKIFSNDIY